MQNKILSEYWAEAKEYIKRRSELGEPEFPTGFEFLDEETDGLHRGEIWIVAGKSGSGKTALALQIAKSFADNPNHTILFISLEMKGWELTTRMFCEMNGISFKSFIRGEYPDKFKEYDTNFLKYIRQLDFEIYEYGYTFQEIEAIVKEGFNNKHPDIMVLDFVQMISKEGVDERTALDIYMRNLKEWAKRYNMGFLIISQLRRPPSGSNLNKPPDIYDLKGSGFLEQVADKVIVTYKEINETDEIEKHFIRLAKNRQGQTMTKEVDYKGYCYKFVEKGVPSSDNEKVRKAVGGRWL